MLLDFNLAYDPADFGIGSEQIGGTLAYMAPEHLEAVIERKAGRIDHRADLYSLGLVLLEAVGFPPKAAADATAGEAPYRYLEHRRSGPPEPRRGVRTIPPALRAVLRRCLEPDPADRYDSAAELAADLQAVADSAPLRFAHEPMASRMAGWARRNRVRMAVAIPILVFLVELLVRMDASRESEVRRMFCSVANGSSSVTAPGRGPTEVGRRAGRGLAGSARPEGRRPRTAR